MTRCKLIAAACVLPLAGCAALSTETKVEEGAFQALNAIDMAQTLTIADRDSPRLWERNPILGRHPAPAVVAGYFVASAGWHLLVTHELTEHGAPPWVLRTWEGLTIGAEVACVADNVHNHVPLTLSVHYAPK